jgi:hypothetical protein
LSLPKNQFDSWAQLKQAFIDNFIAMCDQLGNKYDLERIHDHKDEPLHDYIRRFSDMCLKIPKISHDEAISAFIKGLRHHDALRSKLLQKQPTTVSELLATTKNYTNADDAKIIKEDVGRPSRPEHPPRHDDNRDDRGRNDSHDRCDQRNDNHNHRDNRDQWRDSRDAFRGKRLCKDNHEVNAVKKPSGHRDYNKALKGPC